MNRSFSKGLRMRLLHSFEWMKPIVEKLCSAVALEVAMLKSLVIIFCSSGHSRPYYLSWQLMFSTMSSITYSQCQVFQATPSICSMKQQRKQHIYICCCSCCLYLYTHCCWKEQKYIWWETLSYYKYVFDILKDLSKMRDSLKLPHHVTDKNLVYLLIIGKDRVRRSTHPSAKDTILIYWF